MVQNSIISSIFALVIFGLPSVLPLFLDSSLKLAAVTKIGYIISDYSGKTMQLLNQLCNESQENKPMNRDACYGCFFRAATSHQSGYPLLLSMANCADNYLNNTDYGHCAEYLKVRECIGEAARIMPNFMGTSSDLAQLFVNTSACILAKTRCVEPNPITGASRDDWSKLGGNAINALVVNSEYDINIVRLPITSPTIDECQKYRNVEIAGWPGVDC